MTYEVGSGQIPIFPIFRGFRRAVTSEVDGATAEAGQRFQRGFRRAGDDTGRDVGAGFRRGFQRSSAGLTGDVQKEVAAAARAVSTARLREQDAAGKVRVAEAQLAEARSKYAADSSQVVRAEERLASASRVLAQTQSVTGAATDRLTAAQRALAAATEQAARAGGASRFRTLATNVRGLFAPVTLLGRGLGDLVARGVRPALDLLGQVGSTVSRVVSPALRGLGNVAVSATRPIVSAMSNVASVVRGGVVSAFSSAASAAQRVLGPALERLSPLGSAIGTSVSSGVAIAQQALGGISSVVGTVASGISGAFDVAMGAVRRVAGDAATFVESSFKAAGAAIAVAFGASLVGGFNRLAAIETARARMRGLGLSIEQVNAAMTLAEEKAMGTAFSLDEMASAAGLALTVGVRDGDLAGYLDTIRNTATASGAPLNEIARILGKVQTQGRAYTLEINQLADRQIPIWKALQEQLGLTAEETRKMVADGKVDFATFQAAVNSVVGNLAEEMGGTTESILRNTRTAVSRFGASILSGLYPVIGPVFTTIRKGIDAAGAAIRPVTDAIGTAVGERLLPILERLNTWFDGIKAVTREGFDLSSLTGPLAILAPLIGGLLGSLGGLLRGIPVIGGAFAGITGPLGVVVGVLASLLALSPELRDAFAGVGSAVSVALAGIGPMLSGLLPLFTQMAQQVGGMLAEAVVKLTPHLVELVTLFAGLIADVLPVLLPLVTQVVGVVIQLASQLLAGLMPAFRALVPVILAVVEALVPIVSAIIDALLPALMPLIDAVLALLAPILELLSPLLEIIGAILPPLIALFVALLAPILNVATGLAQSLIPIVEALTRTLGGLIDFIVGVFTGDWERAWKGIQNFFGGIWDGIVGIVKGALNVVVDLLNGWLGAFDDVGQLLQDITGGVIGFDIEFRIPRLANGAVVRSSRGRGQIVNVGESAYDEAVLPLGGSRLREVADAIMGAMTRQDSVAARGLSRGAGQVIEQIVVNPAPGIDEVTLARAVLREARWVSR